MPKFFYLFIPVIFLSITACDNEIVSSQVPSIVKNTFKHQFPHAKNMEWEIANSDYEVDFEIRSVDHTALLDSSGNLLKYKYEIEETALPNKIKSFLELKYPQEKWEDHEHIKDGNSNYFQLKLDGFFNDKKLVVDSMGKELPNIKYWN